MKILLLMITLVTVLSPTGKTMDKATVTKSSAIKVIHISHSVIVHNRKKTNEKELILNRIEYLSTCKNGVVKIKIIYFKAKGGLIIEEKRVALADYIQLWQDLNMIGLGKITLLPLLEAVDPFEFIDVWRTGYDTYHLRFEKDPRKIDFILYDIESYRDKRFLEILNRLLLFFRLKNTK